MLSGGAVVWNVGKIACRDTVKAKGKGFINRRKCTIIPPFVWRFIPLLRGSDSPTDTPDDICEQLFEGFKVSIV